MKFYQKTWFIILTLVFLAPLGVFLMWKYKSWNKVVKTILSLIFLFPFIIIVAVIATVPYMESVPSTERSSVSTSAPVSAEDSKATTDVPIASSTPSIESSNTSADASASAPALNATMDFNATMFANYVKQDFTSTAIKEIVYNPQDGYITIDFDIVEGDYPVVTTQEEGEALALYACSKVANLFEHSKGLGLYPSGTEVTFNGYYLGENIFGFTFDADVIENTDWLTITAEEFTNLWKNYYIN